MGKQKDKNLKLYKKLLKFLNILNTRLEIKRVMELAVKELSGLFNVERASIFIVDEESGKLWTIAAINHERIELNKDRGIAGYVARTGRKLISFNPQSIKYFDSTFDQRNGFHTRDIFALPVKWKDGKVIGVIEFINRKGAKPYGKDEIKFARVVANELGVILKNTLLIEEHKEIFESLIGVMAATIDARHPITTGHSERIAKYAVEIGKEYGLSDDRLEVLKYAAILHDYGKIIVPDHLLRKTSALTPEEFELMKMHPIVTFNILSKVRFPEHLKDVPYVAAFHHERVNGQGYPYGKKENEIPVEAKILAVADVFDAITSEREYHKAYSYEKGKEEILKGSGTRFDPKVVEAFMRFYEKNFGKVQDVEKRKIKKNI